MRALKLALPCIGAVACSCRTATTTSRTAAPAVGDAVVETVVDGDTIDVVIAGRRERVRMLGIDTPEVHPDDGPPECFGPEAAAFTASLLPPGSEIRLERDIVGRDHYGRLLAHVYRRDDELLVNEAILREGYAQPMTIEPNRAFADRYVAATVAAEREGLGLWRSCAG
jgi:endonuclease YncB( thermonuclease family)